MWLPTAWQFKNTLAYKIKILKEKQKQFRASPENANAKKFKFNLVEQMGSAKGRR